MSLNPDSYIFGMFQAFYHSNFVDYGLKYLSISPLEAQEGLKRLNLDALNIEYLNIPFLNQSSGKS